MELAKQGDRECGRSLQCPPTSQSSISSPAATGRVRTTFAKEFLPHEVKCLRFYNADELARGLSPLDPAAVDFKAGRLLLVEVRDSIKRKEIFAWRAL